MRDETPNIIIPSTANGVAAVGAALTFAASQLKSQRTQPAAGGSARSGTQRSNAAAAAAAAWGVATRATVCTAASRSRRQNLSSSSSSSSGGAGGARRASEEPAHHRVAFDRVAPILATRRGPARRDSAQLSSAQHSMAQLQQPWQPQQPTRLGPAQHGVAARHGLAAWPAPL